MSEIKIGGFSRLIDRILLVSSYLVGHLKWRGSTSDLLALDLHDLGFILVFLARSFGLCPIVLRNDCASSHLDIRWRKHTANGLICKMHWLRLMRKMLLDQIFRDFNLIGIIDVEGSRQLWVEVAFIRGLSLNLKLSLLLRKLLL